MEQQQITAWNVKGAVVNGVVQAIDYEKILVQFGSQLLTPRLIERFEKLTGRKAHHYMRRGIFYSHRDFDKILDLYEQGKKFYLYTGRGPSSKSLHAGHMIPFIFCQYLQEAFDVPIVIQMTDDEKFLVNNMTMQEGALCLKNNVKDIIACGFDLKKTFIFSNFRYYSGLLPNILKVNKRLTVNDSNKAFGFSELDCIGKFGFPAVQMVPCFSDSFPHIFGASSSVPCLIPCAIDQDVYFRLLRRVVAPQLKYKKPSLLHSKFFPALQGAQTKMSASVSSSSIFCDDSMEVIEKKIMEGAQCENVDTSDDTKVTNNVVFTYLTFYMEDDQMLDKIKADYSAKLISKMELKKILVTVLQEFFLNFQQKRKTVTDELVEQFMTVREMKFD